MGIQYNDTDKIIDVEHKFKSAVNPWLDYLFAVYLLFIGFLSLVLNTIVLAVCYHKRRTLEPPQWFIVALAINDLMWVATGFFMPIVAGFYHYWMFGDAGCTIYAFVSFLVGIYHITLLALMSIVRWCKMCPPGAGHLITGRNILIMLTSAFFYSLAWSVFPLVGWGDYGVERFGLSCSVNWSSRGVSASSFVVALFVCLFILPIVIIVFCYSRIFYHISSQEGHNRTYRGGREKSRQMLKVMVMISLAFIITWTPYAITSLWTTSVDDSNLPDFFPVISLLPCLFAKTSTIVNPCIYFFSVQQFQRHTKDTFTQVINRLQDAARVEEMDSIRISSLQLPEPEENEEVTCSILSSV